MKNIIHSHHLYNILVKITKLSRDQLAKKLNENNIGVGIHYKHMGDYTFYKNKFNLNSNNFSNSQKIGKNNLSLPLSASMNLKDAKDVVNAIKRFLMTNKELLKNIFDISTYCNCDWC